MKAAVFVSLFVSSFFTSNSYALDLDNEVDYVEISDPKLESLPFDNYAAGRVCALSGFESALILETKRGDNNSFHWSGAGHGEAVLSKENSNSRMS